MAAAVWYPLNRSDETQRRLIETSLITLVETKHKKRGRPPQKEREKTMSPTNGTPEQKQTAVTRTVFDLNAFDDVKLSKPFVAPTKPTSIEEALAAVDNNAEKLLSVIHEGLVAEAREKQYNDLSGFAVVGEDGKPTETIYDGKPVTEEQGKLINGAVLNMAKMLAGGSWDTLDKTKKAELKEQAIGFVRSNPAMIQSIQGAA